MKAAPTPSKIRKVEMYLAFLTLFLFIAFVATPFFCKTYLNENFNTVVGTVLGDKDVKNRKTTKETIKEQIDKIFLNFFN